MGLVNANVRARLHRSFAICTGERARELIPMSQVSHKLLLSIIGVVLLSPVLATALIVGARVAEVRESNGNDLLLVALAFGGAAVSALNGLGRRMAGLDRAPRRRRELPLRREAMGRLNY